MKRYQVVRTVLALTLSLAVSAVACGVRDEGRGEEAAVTRDSAGVRIVTSRVPAGGFAAYATLSPSPSLMVGADGPEGRTPLGEVTGASSLPGGGIAVADGASRVIRFFSAAGEPIAVVGGEGPDSARFESVSRMGPVSGDTVWVADHRGARLAFVTPEGIVGRYAFTFGLTVGGRFADDSYLMVPAWSLSLLEAGWKEGVRRDSAWWGVWWPRSGGAHDLLRFPLDEMMVLSSPEGPVAGVPPFGRRTSRVVGAEEFLVGDQVAFEVRRYHSDGALAGIIRLEGVDLTLTEELKASVRPPRVEGDTSLVDRLWQGVPPTRPAYTRLLLDAVGDLWVAEHVAGSGPPRTWLVFSPAGAALGFVAMPPGFEVHEIGADWVLGAASVPGGYRVARFALSPER